MTISKESTVLTSWKEIARYLGKGVRTVQRWEQELGLPVRRPIGASHKSAVLLHREDVDNWLATRFSARSIDSVATSIEPRPQSSVRSELQKNMHRANELRLAQQALTIQIAESIRMLAERCDRITTQSRQSPWSPALPVSLAPPPGRNGHTPRPHRLGLPHLVQSL